MAKYNKQIIDTICSYIKNGDSQKTACKKAGIAESTLYEWLKKKKELSEAIKKAKDEFQDTIVGKLEASLWKRAMGYEVTETEMEYTRDAKGELKIKSKKTKIKHIQPDTGALIFALTNVAPDKWVNRQKVETQEVRKESENTNNDCFADLPEETLIDIADKIQEAAFKAKENNGKEER